MVSNLSWFDAQVMFKSSNSHDFSATWHTQHHNKQIFILCIYSMTWTNQFSKHHRSGGDASKIQFQIRMRENYTHQRSCSKCQTESRDTNKAAGWGEKKKFTRDIKTKERCNKYLNSHFFPVLRFADFSSSSSFFWDFKQTRR